MADAQGTPLLYANLAVRGRKTHELVEQQLEPALAMRPDLVTVFSGTNDVIRSGFDLDAVLTDLRLMHRAFRETGATVLTITMPDLSDIVPFAHRIAPRLAAFNAGVRALCAETGVLLLDVAQHPVATDRRLWHEDRLHANSEGHRRIAAGLAHVLGIPGFDGVWTEPLPPSSADSFVQRAQREIHWVGTYLLPWVLRRLTRRSSGDAIIAKRPHLTPLDPTNE